MKTSKFLNRVLAFAFAMSTLSAFAQQPELQFFRSNDKDGLNVFETSKDNQVEFTGIKARLGGDFALQFQGLSQTNAGDTLAELASNFNLPTANLNIDVQMADGVRLHMRTYLSSKHHTEAYVKGGYLQIDNLNFISEGFASGFMNIATIKFGMDEINYGDTHFRRSDNARAIFNPFVGNYIMDSFTTEPYAEITVLTNGLIIVAGATNGRLNQSPLPGDDGFAIFGKVGYDSQVNDDLRVRLTASVYSSTDKGTRDYIYGGDRAGSRYYKVFGGGDFDGRFNPRYAYQTAFQINPFVKFQGVEFFGVYENVTNGDDAVGGSFSQIGAELLYRFGAEENFYVGGRYNSVSGKQTDAGQTLDISRLNIGGGWYMTKNILAKVEYMNQQYGDTWSTTGPNSLLTDAQAKGIVFEAVISF